MTQEGSVGAHDYPFLDTHFFSRSQGHSIVELFPPVRETAVARTLSQRGWNCLTICRPNSYSGRLLATCEIGSDKIEEDDAALADLVSNFRQRVIVVDALVIGSDEDEADSFFDDQIWIDLRPRIAIIARARTDFQRLAHSARELRYSDGPQAGPWHLLCRREDARTLLPFLQAGVGSEHGWAEASARKSRHALAEKDAAIAKLCADVYSAEVVRSQMVAELDAASQELRRISSMAAVQVASMREEIRAAAMRRAATNGGESSVQIFAATPETASLGARQLLLDREAGSPIARVFARKRVSRAFAERKALVLSSGLFDPSWYLDRYGDVAMASRDALCHFVEYGSLEHRDPGPGFNTQAYLACYPDVASEGIEPFFHYLVHGRREGRFDWRTAGFT